MSENYDSDEPVLERRHRYIRHGWARSSYQTTLIPCKESDMIMCMERDVSCVCMREKEKRQKIDG